MMKAELKRIHSPDADLDVYYPDDPENFSLFLQLMIGPEGEDSEESFDILICTPKWILDNKKLEGVVLGRHMMIVFEYDFSIIKSVIFEQCQKCVGFDWQEISTKLSRFAHWEFEDYQP